MKSEISKEPFECFYTIRLNQLKIISIAYISKYETRAQEMKFKKANRNKMTTGILIGFCINGHKWIWIYHVDKKRLNLFFNDKDFPLLLFLEELANTISFLKYLIFKIISKLTFLYSISWDNDPLFNDNELLNCLNPYC